MSEPQPEMTPIPWWRRKWVTVGEVIAIAGLGLALLGYLDAHRQRTAEQAERVTASHRAAPPAPLVLRAQPVAEGARLDLAPMRADQAVQSQRYLFPAAVLDHVMEVAAAQPQVQAVWVRDGLLRELDRAAKATGGKPAGSGELPVGVITTYVQDGELRTDRSLYLVGYRVDRAGLLGRDHLILQGLALGRRGVADDLQGAVEARWAR